MGATRAMPMPGGGGFNMGGLQTMGSGLGSFLSGLMDDSAAPYQAAEDAYNQFLQQGKNIQQPYYQMGTSSIPLMQNWLQGMQNPSGFINNLMGQYQQSPWAKYQQEQAIRMANNQGSASGLAGSTPMTQFMQQNAQNISSQDMQNWLQNVLGINTQYGAGLGNMMAGGQNAANSITNLLSNFGNNIAEANFGEQAGQQQDMNNMWGGLINMGMGALEL